MIGHKRIPSREGGVEVVVEELSVRMAALGHNITVYNRSGGHVSGTEYGRAEKVKSYKGVRVITVPTLQNRSLNALIYSFLASLHALFGGYDLIHYHAEGPSAMLFIPALFGKTTVSTVHGLDWQRSKWSGFASRFLMLGERTLAKKADAVIVLSENAKRYFEEAYSRKTYYIPNAVSMPVKLGPSEIRTKYGLKGGDYILFLARIVPEKGIHYLLEAFSKVKTDKMLVIAGGGSHTEDYVRQMRQLASKDKRVIMTGFVQGDELSELYTNCCLYVLPSDIEGMPLSLLEAMSYGCRCLVSDIWENTSVSGSFAFSFKAGDVNDLQEKLQSAADGNLTYPSPEDISAYILSHFSWDDITAQTLDLYKKQVLNNV